MNLRISALNINGLISKRPNKIKTHEFQDILDNSDVVLLTEAWTSDHSDIKVNHFESFELRRKEKKEKCKAELRWTYSLYQKSIRHSRYSCL